ncbi:DUF421 domain-containing protein [Streptomyces sp. NBC_00144]|uniref:YetF domain-containing protein n=1 Tax=Streptomyces sp. NBC_00144 TaxID=2975665 RepID=UPI003249D264
MRLLEGKPTTVIHDGKMLAAALRHLALRPGEIEHAVRLQNEDDISEIAEGRLEPEGQLVIVLKPSQQSANRGDFTRIETTLTAIEELMATHTTGPGNSTAP